MKKLTYIFTMTVLFLMGYSYSMELVPFVQKKNAEEKVNKYCTKTLPTLKLSEIHKRYCDLPEDCRNKLILHLNMYDKLLLLHQVALWLPNDVQQHIIVQMFDGDAESAKIFYENPISLGFELCQRINNSVKNPNKPIATLFKMEPKKRNSTLEKLNPFYSSYCNPIMSIEEQKQIHEDDTIRQYFEGKDVIILPEDEEHFCTGKRMTAIAGGSTAAGGLTAAGIFSVGACVGGKSCICETSFLWLVLGLSCGLVPCVGCSLATAIGMITLTSNTKKVTFEVPENLTINDDSENPNINDDV